MPPIHCFFSQRYQLWMRHRYPQVFMIIAIPAHLFLAVFRAYLPYKLPVLPPEYFVGPNCYVLRYARQIFSWVPNLHKRRISQPVLGFDITVRASAFTGAGVGINARLPDMALYTSPVYFSFRAKNDITRPQMKTSCSNGRGVFAIS